MRITRGFASLVLSVVVGCVPVAKERSRVRDEVEDQPHGVGGIVWAEKGIAHGDVVIDLGYQDEYVDGARWLQPVAAITRQGVPVANAMVFHNLTSPGGDVIAEERATVYEISLDAETPLYTQAKLRLPENIAQCTVQFRIVLPDSPEEWTRDVMVQVATGHSPSSHDTSKVTSEIDW